MTESLRGFKVFRPALNLNKEVLRDVEELMQDHRLNKISIKEVPSALVLGEGEIKRFFSEHGIKLKSGGVRSLAEDLDNKLPPTTEETIYPRTWPPEISSTEISRNRTREKLVIAVGSETVEYERLAAQSIVRLHGYRRDPLPGRWPEPLTAGGVLLATANISESETSQMPEAARLIVQENLLPEIVELGPVFISDNPS